jgi:endonuclease/exonuclease/phosphatase family metal-dependent hydrolase
MSDPSTLRLLTWNVWWRFGGNWRERQPAIAALLGRENPDLVGLQECWGTAETNQAEELAAGLGGHAAFVRVGLPPAPNPPEYADQHGVEMGLGLVSRWPLATVAAEPMPSEGRELVALRAVVEHPRGPLQVVVGATSWEPDRVDETSRQLAELERLVLAADTARPSFLLADLNYDFDLPAMQALRLNDGWAAAPPAADPRTLSSTNRFAPPEATAQYDRRIDHILFTPGSTDARATAARILRDEPGGFPPSDHYPVVVDVEF